MIAFTSISRDPTGRSLRCLHWADTAHEVRQEIVRRGGIVLAIKRSAKEKPRKEVRIPSAVAIAAANQLAMLIDADVPFDAALKGVIRECPDRRAKAMLAAIHEKICSTGRVAEAFALYPRQFPPHLQQLIHIGHGTGTLATSFREVARNWSENQEITNIVKRALTYPCIALLVVGSVVFFLLGYVLPLFDRIYGELGIRLPLLTRACVGMSQAFNQHLTWLGCAAGLSLFAAVSVARMSGPRRTAERWVARLPGVKGVLQSLATSRIAGLMAALQRAGMPVQDAITLCIRGGGNAFYEDAMVRAGRLLSRGSPLSDALERTQAFPSVAVGTLRIGEQTNRLHAALDHVREHFARDASNRVQRLLQFLEPALTLGLGLCVGTVAVSLFFPLMTLAMNIKR